MTDNPSSLYSAWLNALPQAFRMLTPASATATATAPADGGSPGQPLPFPADQIGKALGMLDGILTQLYQSYLPLLAQGDLSSGAIRALADAATESFDRLVAAYSAPAAALSSLPAWSALAQPGQPWASLLHMLVPGGDGTAAGANQLQLGMERSFGGLSDAFGLRPMRELEQAWRDMLAAGSAKQRAQIGYLALVVQAWNKGTNDLLKELQAMGERGERVESLLAFIRLWAKAVDEPLHDAMQGARGLEVTTQLIRASTHYREQLQRAVGLASEALHLPTRADVDEAYREIQELKRELRRLKRALPTAARGRLLQAKEAEE